MSQMAISPDLSGTSAYWQVGGLGTCATLTTGAASAASAEFTEDTVVLLKTTVSCHVRHGVTPVAVATDWLLEPGEILPVSVLAGEKIAAIQDSSAGTVYIQPLL